MLIHELKTEYVNEKTSVDRGDSAGRSYEIDWEKSLVTVSISEKIMMQQFEPAEIAASLQVPVKAECENIESAIEEITQKLRVVVSKEIAKLRKIRALISKNSNGGVKK
jgi:hypothetical protein